jgi:hypothetical protein
MNYLQIWIGNKPSDEIIKYMKSVLSFVTKDDTYTLIAEKKWITNKKINFININDYVNEMNQTENIKEAWNNIPNDKNFYWAKADLIRFHYLSKNENVLYCDTDIILHYSFQPEDKIYFGNLSYFFDYFIMYNGTNLLFFQNLMDLIINKYNYMIKRGKINKTNLSHQWCWNIINLPNFRKLIHNIPDNVYEHVGMWYKGY